MSNGTGKPKRAMQLGGALIAIAGLLVSLIVLASAQSAASQGPYSGNISGPDSCLAMSLGGPVLVPSDTDNDGVYDTCVQPYSLREATARQNAKEAFSNLLTDYFGQLFAQECVLAASTFGQPAAEATDECASPRVSYAQGTPLASLPAVPPTAAPQTSALCTNQSRGGQTTYPTDTDNNGIADACTLPRTVRAAVARQNALNRLAAEYPVPFNTILQQQCQSLPATFGEPTKEATDICSPYYEPSPTGTPLPTRTPTVTPSPTPGTSPGTSPGSPGGTTPPSWNSPTGTKPSAAKAKAPQSLALDPGQTNITVSWSAPTEDASSVSGYRVWWAKSNQGYSNSSRTPLLTSSTTSYSITGLTTYTTYKAKVEAVRTTDQGVDSPTLTATPGIPGPPIWPAYTDSKKPNTSSGDPLHNDEYGEIDITWSEPTGSNIPVSHYIMQWRSSSQSWSTSRQRTTNSSPETITDLGYGSTYYVRVLAVGDNTPPGMWAPYESVRLTSNLPAPGRPTKLTLSEGANLTIAATWTAPLTTTYEDADDQQLPGNQGSNQPTHYVVRWRNRTDGGSWQQKDVPESNTCDSKTTDTTTTISNLVSGKKYEVQVRGVNCKRPGSWSSSAQITLSIVDPPTITAWIPASQDVSGTIRNDVQINWSVPTTHPTPTNVVLQWNTSSYFSNCTSSSTCVQVGYTSSTTNHTFQSLVPGKTYYARMRSISNYGPGPWSSTTSAKAATRKAPSSVSVSAGSTYQKLDVSWSNPSDADKLPITKYRIEWRKKGSTSWPSYHITSDKSSTTDVNEALLTDYTITGLSAETTYEVRVLATNAYGNGPWSVTAEGTTSAKPDN